MSVLGGLLRSEFAAITQDLVRYFLFALGGVLGGIVYAVFEKAGVSAPIPVATGIFVGVGMGTLFLRLYKHYKGSKSIPSKKPGVQEKNIVVSTLDSHIQKSSKVASVNSIFAYSEIENISILLKNPIEVPLCDARSIGLISYSTPSFKIDLNGLGVLTSEGIPIDSSVITFQIEPFCGEFSTIFWGTPLGNEVVPPTRLDSGEYLAANASLQEAA